jgi:hypothetical protein
MEEEARQQELEADFQVLWVFCCINNSSAHERLAQEVPGHSAVVVNYNMHFAGETGSP